MAGVLRRKLLGEPVEQVEELHQKCLEQETKNAHLVVGVFITARRGRRSVARRHRYVYCTCTF